MKKNYLKFAAFAIMMALTACTSEVIEVSNPNTPSSNLTLGPGEDIVRINLTNTVSTRAARPISNSKADNNINRIAFKFLKSDGTEYSDFKLEEVIDLSSGKQISNYTVVNNVLQLPEDLNDGESINIKFSNLGKDTSYKIIAYGYNNKDDEKTFPYTINIDKKNDSGEFMLTCDQISTSPIEEIFAGASGYDTYIGVNQHGKFEEVPQITMKRQVAALLVYFKDAPVFVNNEQVEKITVSTKYQATGFYFPAELLGTKNNNDDFNGIGQGTENGSWVDYLTFDMSKASNYSDDHTSGDTYEFMSEEGRKGDGSNFLLAKEMTEIEGLECQDNTLFGSCFLLPFPQELDFSVNSYKCATLNICYWKKTDSNTYELITSIPLKKGSKTEGEELDNSDNYQYDIRCNNFYHIGKKTTTGLPDPENPDEENEEDEPTSIDEPTGWDYATIGIDEGYEVSNELFN